MKLDDQGQLDLEHEKMIGELLILTESQTDALAQGHHPYAV